MDITDYIKELRKIRDEGVEFSCITLKVDFVVGLVSIANTDPGHSNIDVTEEEAVAVLEQVWMVSSM